MSAKLIPLRRVRGEPEEMSDGALVAACATGDTTALGALFDRHKDALLAFLARIGATDAEIDDVVQSTFIEVQRSAARFRSKSSVRTWIFGIAVNVLRHHARSESRRRSWSLSFASEPPVPAVRPDDAASQSEILDYLGKAIARLPHDLRVAFVLCDVEGSSGTEAARALSIPEGTLYRRLHDARKRLKADMEGLLR